MNKVHELADLCVALTSLVMAIDGLLTTLHKIVHEISALVG